jgi:hypothetical protein
MEIAEETARAAPQDKTSRIALPLIAESSTLPQCHGCALRVCRLAAKRCQMSCRRMPGNCALGRSQIATKEDVVLRIRKICDDLVPLLEADVAYRVGFTAERRPA